jgi:hypothetical protein
MQLCGLVVLLYHRELACAAALTQPGIPTQPQVATCGFFVETPAAPRKKYDHCPQTQHLEEG